MFKISADSTGFTTLHSFTALSGSYPGPYTNNEGASPNELILSGNTLYGTAFNGGSSGKGTVFKVNTDGMDFTNLHSFTALSGFYPNYTNSDGAGPYAGLILRIAVVARAARTRSAIRFVSAARTRPPRSVSR